MKFIITFVITLFSSVIIGTGNIQAQTNKDGMDGMNHSMDASLMIMNGWVRLTPPVAKNGAAYFMLHNSSDKDVIVVEIKTTIAETAAMHDVVVERSMAKMVHLEKLIIPAGKMVDFSPGGKHLMLINLTEKLVLDSEINFTFTLSNGEIINSVMQVKKSNNSSSEHNH